MILFALCEKLLLDLSKKAIYLQQTQKNMEWRCPILLILVSVESIYLKIEDFFCVLKMVSFWTLSRETIVFFWSKCFISEKLKEFCVKRTSYSFFITQRAGKTQFLPFIYAFYCKKTILKVLIQVISTEEVASLGI